MRKNRRFQGLTALVALLGATSFGCQIVGGLASDLEVQGAGATGGGGSGGDAGGLPAREPLIWVAEDPGPTFVYTLPDWMDFGNLDPTPKTSQIGPSTLRTGYGPKDPRPRNVGSGWGLSLETERTNVVASSGWRLTGWTKPSSGGMATNGSEPDPAGELGAIEFISMGLMQSNTATAQGKVATSWLRGKDGAAPYAYFAHGNAAVSVTSPDWARYELRRDPADTNGSLRLETQPVGDLPPIFFPTSVLAYGAQVEEGLYPSSLIPTNGAAATRLGDLLRVRRADLAPKGYFDVTIRYAPHYATDEQTYDHDLLAIEDDGLFLRMRVGGTLMLVAGSQEEHPRIENLSWSRDQEIEVRAQYLPDKRVITVRGSMAGEVSTEILGTLPPLELDSKAWILGDSDGPQESADLRYLEMR